MTEDRYRGQRAEDRGRKTSLRPAGAGPRLHFGITDATIAKGF